MAHIARLVWALGLLVGASTHVAAIFRCGLCSAGVPIPTVVFWNALTVLDPLAAVLLFVRPRAGVVLTVAIMVADVAHNVWAFTAMPMIVWPVVLQAAFLAFVVVAAPIVWRDARPLSFSARTKIHEQL